MRFQTPLVPARLIRRYKRFLADVRLADGQEVTAHCPNPGAMTGLADPGATVWLEPNDDPRKKLKFGWRLVELPGGGFACIDTGVANRVVGEALGAGQIEAFRGCPAFRAEVRYGEASRVDFLVDSPKGPPTYLEVKSVTLKRRKGNAEFPDTTTKRGARHMGDLAAMVASGARATVLYLVQRGDCNTVSLAGDIDPAYLAAFSSAQDMGVEVLAYRANINPDGVTLGDQLCFIS